MKKQDYCYLIDKLLADNWFEDDKEVIPWILARRVLVDERPAYSLKEKIKTDSKIRIREYYKRKYVNKGGLKLEHALDYFKIELTGKTALDCGASTGGFTDCLITYGANKVYAVDVGYGQLAGKLLTNPKVVNMEKTNLSSPLLCELDPKPDVITLDLSYLSLVEAIPICKDILQGREGIIICLIKPLFEVDSFEIKRSGNINDRETLRATLTSLCEEFIKQGTSIIGLTNSPITGNNGTYEYFAALNMNNEATDIDLNQSIDIAIENSFQLHKFDKNKYI